MGSVGSNNREKSITVNAEGSNVSSRSEVTSNSSLDLSNRTSEQLDALYESAAASRDRELMQAILTELDLRKNHNRVMLIQVETLGVEALEEGDKNYG